MKAAVKYMHTINSRPAWFDGEQVCYAVKTKPIKLVGSLDELRQQQRDSAKWRKSVGFDVPAYDYVRVEVAS